MWLCRIGIHMWRYLHGSNFVACSRCGQTAPWKSRGEIRQRADACASNRDEIMYMMGGGNRG